MSKASSDNAQRFSTGMGFVGLGGMALLPLAVQMPGCAVIFRQHLRQVPGSVPRLT